MAPAAPTPEELYARLRALSDATSDEQLAIELGIRHRTLTRLKAGEGTVYETTIKLLDAAGWLNLGDEADARARLRQSRRFVEEALQDLLELREAVEGVVETSESTDQAGP